MTRLVAARPLRVDLPQAAAFEAALDGFEIDATADLSLLVLTEDAGSATALRFHAEALAAGVALANPAAFPWCLANAPCAAIARRFGLTGPNATWLVETLEAPEGYAPAAAWLDGEPSPALIAAARFGGPAPRLLIWRWSPEAGAPVTSRLCADWHDAARRADARRQIAPA